MFRKFPNSNTPGQAQGGLDEEHSQVRVHFGLIYSCFQLERHFHNPGNMIVWDMSLIVWDMSLVNSDRVEQKTLFSYPLCNVHYMAYIIAKFKERSNNKHKADINLEPM